MNRDGSLRRLPATLHTHTRVLREGSDPDEEEEGMANFGDWGEGDEGEDGDDEEGFPIPEAVEGASDDDDDGEGLGWELVSLLLLRSPVAFTCFGCCCLLCVQVCSSTAKRAAPAPLQVSKAATLLCTTLSFTLFHPTIDAPSTDEDEGEQAAWGTEQVQGGEEEDDDDEVSG